MSDSADSKKDFYKAAYAGQARNSWTGNRDRRAIVQKWAIAVSWEFNLPIKCLDIGCGQGLHTAWIGDQSTANSNWTGIDIVDAEIMKLEIPPFGRFAVANLRADGWTHPYLEEKYTLIVDQGAVFVSLDDDIERDTFLANVAAHLETHGVFIGLVVHGEWGRWVFPDGRVRFKMTESDINDRKDDWERRFGLRVVDTVCHTYPPDHPNNRIFPHDIIVMHVIFQKV